MEHLRGGGYCFDLLMSLNYRIQELFLAPRFGFGSSRYPSTVSSFHGKKIHE